MTANQIFLTLLICYYIVALTGIVASLKWGLRWPHIANISYPKAFGLLILFLVAELIVGTLVCIPLALARIEFSQNTMSIVGVVMYFVVVCAALMIVYRARLSCALIATCCYGFAFLVLGFIAPLAIRWRLYEAFVVPTNSMAPTILGEHLEAPCPNCGAPAYGLRPRGEHASILPDGVQMICSQELRTVVVKKPPSARYPGDRIVVCKQLAPKRWDLIAFRDPQDHSVSYVKRLVGLPNEQVAIHDGSVWINGNKVAPPAAIHNIHYEPTIQYRGETYSGPGSVPVTLASDEYFVLGDFGDMAQDSRIWQRGAPGHPPYAVPTENLIGVVTNIYWPPSRWTSFR
ncbi:MAG TPA: signal peptidase I [Lacipirellulaceae bacterium]|nr:signal peptidase I [Lacipirellulaceae bacterium]